MLTVDKSVADVLQPKRVLVVDDEPYSRKVVRTLLASLGVRQVFEAGDGVSGMEAILTFSPDVVLVDWQMPGLDGPGFLRQVRAPGKFPQCDIPIIILTGHGERACVTEAVKLGVHEYLLKPVSAHALMTRLMSIFLNPRRMIRKGSYYGPSRGGRRHTSRTPRRCCATSA